MAPRANWKGDLKVGDLTCPVAFFTAASTSERIAFHILNRKTGDRVHRQFVDSETGKPVDAKDQVKGYERSRGDYIVLDPEEIEVAIPESDKTLAIQVFVPCDQIDDIYFDRPYYLAPSTAAGSETFDLLRDGMRSAKVVAIARTMLFHRVRSVLIRPHGVGLVASTLNFDYEIRSLDEAFSDLPNAKVDTEMLELVLHIIKTKAGKFEPEKFDDRYEAALLDLVKAKMEGRKINPPKPPAPTKATDLMAALRESAKEGTAGGKPSNNKTTAKRARRRKAA